MQRQTQVELLFRIVEEMLEEEILEMEREIRRDHVKRQGKALTKSCFQIRTVMSAESQGNGQASLRPVPSTGGLSKWHQPE